MNIIQKAKNTLNEEVKEVKENIENHNDIENPLTSSTTTNNE